MGHPLKPVQEEAQVPSGRTTGFEGRAPLLYRGDVDTAYSIIRSVLTSAQAGITWGVPVARAERVTDSGGRGSWSLDWREDVGPGENSERPFMREVAKFSHES